MCGNKNRSTATASVLAINQCLCLFNTAGGEKISTVTACKRTHIFRRIFCLSNVENKLQIATRNTLADQNIYIFSRFDSRQHNRYYREPMQRQVTKPARLFCMFLDIEISCSVEFVCVCVCVCVRVRVCMCASDCVRASVSVVRWCRAGEPSKAGGDRSYTESSMSRTR